MCDYFIKCAPVFKFSPDDSFSNFSPEGLKHAESNKNQNTASDNNATLPSVANDIQLHDHILEQAQEVISQAKAQKLHLSTAESCTGGLIGGTLTAVAGSSDAVEGGIISYSNAVKEHLLDVSADDLASVGAVSSEVAASMAIGSRNACKSDIAVSVTGIAGPGGAVEGKSVGTVWFGLATKQGSSTFVRHFKGDRAQVRSQTVSFALELFLCALDPQKVFPSESD